MNAIQYALNNLKFTVPRAILEKTFLSAGYHWRSTTTVDEQITSLVIRPRVLVDCNLIGGTQALIPLAGLEEDHPGDTQTVIHIPKSRTQGRSINSVLNVSFLSAAMLSAWSGSNMVGSTGSYAAGENTALMSAMQGMMSAFDKIPLTSTAKVQLIAENTILVRDTFNLPVNAYLRCVLAQDENLSGLQLRTFPLFAQAVQFAVKAYIHNELVIDMDKGELKGGQSLGTIKEVVDGYADANQNYMDHMSDVMAPALFCNDNVTFHRYLKLAIGGNH